MPAESDKLTNKYNELCELKGKMDDSYQAVKTGKTQSMNRLASDYVYDAANFFKELSSFEEDLKKYQINDTGDALLKAVNTGINIWTAVSILLPAVSITGSLARTALYGGGRATATASVGTGIEEMGKTYFFSSANWERTVRHVASAGVQRTAIAQGVGFGTLNVYEQHRANNEINLLRDGNTGTVDLLIGKMENILPGLDQEGREKVLS